MAEHSCPECGGTITTSGGRSAPRCIRAVCRYEGEGVPSASSLPTLCDERETCCGVPACLNAGLWREDPYDEPIGVFEGTRWHMHSEPICADPDCVTYLTRSAMATLRRRSRG